MKNIPSDWLQAQWPAPLGVNAWSTTRQGGVSRAPFDMMNLGEHVQDRMEDVQSNRQRLTDYLQLPAPPSWLQQVHGIHVADLDTYKGKTPIEADASVCRTSKHVCAVMTADCLPVLFCNTHGNCIAAAHAGWRGLCDGVLEATVAAMHVPAQDVMAWLGPAIGPQSFEVGEDVVDAFLAINQSDTACFTATQNGCWLADIYQLARNRLQRTGVHQVYGGGACTFTDTERFYSYRRDHLTGRMASLIWLEDSTN